MTRTSSTNNATRSSPLWRWSLAFLCVCGLGLFAGASSAIPIGDNAGYPKVDTSPDIERIVHNDSSTVIKRSHNTQDTHTKTGDNNPFWYLAVGYRVNYSCTLLYRQSVGIAAAIQRKPAITQQPAAPRAPPLV